MSDTRNSAEAAIFQDALAVASSENYLGNAEVVEGLVRDFIANVLEATTADQVFEECSRVALIFSGSQPGYTPVPDWNTREALGMKCAERHDLDPNQSCVDILRATFGMYATQVRGILIEHVDDQEEDWSWKLDQIIEHCTALMLGTIDTVYPFDEE
jgi:hypothetical protein